jgi:WD40 repeat protein
MNVGFPTFQVNCVAWSPSGRFLASGGLDCTVIVWSMDTPTKHFALPSAHVQSQITGIKWMDDKTIATVGQDGNMKIWNVTWKPE